VESLWPDRTPPTCGGKVEYAGLVLQHEPLQAWPSFSCAQHRDELVGARELLNRDRAVLAAWREREGGALAGEGWDPPQPLAVGAAARELARRTEASQSRL
jgi:hypothetical protein